jgi:excisionase family DNA binding protein
MTIATQEVQQTTKLIQLKEAAAVLGVSPRCLWLWAKDGRFPIIRLGRRFMLRSDVLAQIVERGL